MPNASEEWSIGAALGRDQGLALFRRYVGPHVGRVVVLGGCLLLSTGLSVAGPQVLSRFVNATRSGAPTATLVDLALIFVGIGIGAGLLWISSEYVGAIVSWKATNAMRADLTRHCLGLDMTFFEQHTSGELIERIDGDIGVLASYFSDMFLLAVSNVLLLVGIGVALFIEDWRLGLCYLPFVVASVFLLRRLVGIALPANAEQRRRNALLLGYLEEHLAGLEDVRGNGASSTVVHGFWMRARELMTAVREAARLGVRWPAAAQGLASVGLVAALAAGSAMYLSGSLSLGGLYSLLAYSGMLQAPLMVIVMQFRQLELSVGAMRRVNDLFGQLSTVTDGPTALPGRRPGVGTSVHVDDVSFCYEPGTFALRKVSLTVEPGQRLALVGRTGSGKSTLARLLFRFADPTTGRIAFDGADVREATLHSLRGNVGLVTQDVQIFHASLRDNVTLFDPGVGDDRVVEALTEVGLGPWLADQADGLDSMLGAGAAGLSAGEGQLLAFARVLAADPGLVVLDEASSRLDAASRRQFDAALGRLLTGRTAVIIAHRLEATRIADRVAVLDNGEIVESGDRAELSSDPGSVFAELLRAGEAFA